MAWWRLARGLHRECTREQVLLRLLPGAQSFQELRWVVPVPQFQEKLSPRAHCGVWGHETQLVGELSLVSPDSLVSPETHRDPAVADDNGSRVPGGGFELATKLTDLFLGERHYSSPVPISDQLLDLVVVHLLQVPAEQF